MAPLPKTQDHEPVQASKAIAAVFTRLATVRAAAVNTGCSPGTGVIYLQGAPASCLSLVSQNGVADIGRAALAQGAE